MLCVNYNLCIVCAILLVSCTKEPAIKNIDLEISQTPLGFPQMFVPADNEYTKERWELGKSLFFDPVLSLDGKVSCASCHDPRKAFSDSVSFSLGSDGVIGTRNAPTLANVGYHPYLLREGGVPTLEMQVLVPIEEHVEFNHHILKIVEKLADHNVYQTMAQKAYDQAINPYVITRAIANFERTIVSGTSPFDQYKFSFDDNALTSDAKEGMKLFYSEKTNCSVCHTGFNFTNYSFQNNGLYTEYVDPGRQRLTNNPSDHALFKVPTLRNIAVTGPYMHDGSLSGLEEVVEHYNSGGKEHVQKSSLIKPLGLTDLEKLQLISFLESLTDIKFIENKKFRN